MLARRFEAPWRTAYEFYAGCGWALVAVSSMALTPDPVPIQLGAAIASTSASMTIFRFRQTIHFVDRRVALSGKAMGRMTTRQFAKLIKDPDYVFLGYGFEWKPQHSQRLYELVKVDYREYTVSPWLARALGYVIDPQPDAEIGMPFIHGVEPDETPLYRPLQNFEGGTLVVGSTQTGKGVAFGSLITQSIKRGDVVIIIDPKNSKRLKLIVEQACRDYRRPGTFLWFHPAFPETGVRLDFTFNWQKPTEIASRIQSIMPPDTAGAFSAFGWDAINVVVQGLVTLEERPNLVKLTRYIEGGIEPVLEATLHRYYARTFGAAWRQSPEMQRLLDRAAKGLIKSPTPAAGAELLAMVEFYEKYIPSMQREKVIDSQVRTFRHNREHYQKITANLLPILSMLTSGDLGKTLSPDPFDPDDDRPIMNFEKVERAGHVLLMCLDSLPDPSVATAIGALALADYAARSGMRYNLNSHRRIALYVDEVSNVINIPLIEILNKGAEGGVYTTVAMQTLADLAQRLGSENAARMALGNLNNLIAFRTKDRPTQDFIVETFGRTGIHTTRVGRTTATDGHLGDFTSADSAQITETFEETVPAAMLGKLPNIQYFASISGRLLKGRLTLLEPPANIARKAA
ncbi:conjugative transfer system coupling protein TraD [Duganella sp. FT92W]|uniref:Conjugative transfer system coupling protein TraD n=1 Tax=Pseudoduganella rivuli TaxID=2666085 RepID=A0A7X2IIB6_9BURK|nr:conjugative transfer system coupling protein TraD [Pseudoduganella rivuli]MRV70564.1 conjugative transfer system coupling protein TraD [Pseudoduganella rivuli]